MATNVLLPQWGMNMEDGLLVKWLVAEGDAIEAGEPLVEIETAKINSELEAPVSGVVAHIMSDEGTTVDVGAIVVVIGEPGESVPRPSTAKPERPSRARRTARAATDGAARETAQVTPVARRLARQNDVSLDQVRGTGPSGRITEGDVRRTIEESAARGAAGSVQVVPAARKLAREIGVDLAQVQGTGPGGRVLVADVERATQAQPQPIVQPDGAVSEVIALTGLRKIIADRMMQSVQSMAQVTLTTEADVTESVRLMADLVSEWRPHRLRPVDQDLVVKATAAALAQHSRLNATMAGNELRLMEDVNLGVAMAVPDGLMVPVIRDANEKDLLTLAKETRELANRARKGALTVDDVTGATFTISSLASLDIDAFTPIVDPPQVAILGVGRIVEKPAIHDGKIAARSMMFLSLEFDHRALDGVPAGEFLRDVKGRLEDPAWMKAASEAPATSGA
jgi:pyruvate dehydrogenase E2 component (dihydrolipoamide acetyltransferase)